MLYLACLTCAQPCRFSSLVVPDENATHPAPSSLLSSLVGQSWDFGPSFFGLTNALKKTDAPLPVRVPSEGRP